MIAVATLLACTIVLGRYAARVRIHGRTRHARLGASPGSALLPGWVVEAFYSVLHAVGQRLVRLRVDPDALTYLSLACSLASLPLTATGRFGAAALAVALGGGLDALDGMVARALGRACPAGAVLDSFVDRLADAAPLAGLVIFYRDRVWTLAIPLAAMTAFSLVSYARAKADIYGLDLPNGVMRRHERICYLVAALLMAPVVGGSAAGAVSYPVTLAGVALVATLGFVAALILVVRTRAALAASHARAAELARAAQVAAAKAIDGNGDANDVASHADIGVLREGAQPCPLAARFGSQSSSGTPSR